MPKIKKIFDDSWKKEWRDMPEFIMEDINPYHEIKVCFRNQQDVEDFAKKVSLSITNKTRTCWYPKLKKEEKRQTKDEVYIIDKHLSKKKIMPRYPIYIVSKGRWESRLTSKTLEGMGVPYNIVIEPQEYKKYSRVIDKKKILVLPFSNLGQGSIPARNWIWEHSIHGMKSKRHWILDDNIRYFYRLNRNRKIVIASGIIFRITEDFIDRYENVGMAGFNYQYFCPAREPRPPYFLNSRIYSCIILDNSIQHRWRGRYNEDTDLSIRILDDGWCTMLFNAFLCGKTSTLTMKGGNTDELYKDDGRLKMAESLQQQHPYITKITQKYRRYQHHVNYYRLKGNGLILKKGLEIPDGVNEYGIKLISNEKGESFRI